MTTLVLQFVIKQWDKGQQTEAHLQALRGLADRYPVNSPPAISLYNGRILLDQQGDDRMANRLQYQLDHSHALLIDRFRFCLKTRTVEFKQRLQPSATPILLTQLESDAGWVQFHYEWRYRVNEGGFIYWLYEAITVNAFNSDSGVVPADCFFQTSPKQCFKQLMNLS